MSISVVRARDLHVHLFATTHSVVSHFDDDIFDDVAGPALVIDSPDEEGIVVPGSKADLAALHGRIGRALGIVDTRYCAWCEEAQAEAYLAHEGHDPDCPLQPR